MMLCDLIKDNSGSGGAENMLGHQASPHRTDPLLQKRKQDKPEGHQTVPEVSAL